MIIINRYDGASETVGIFKYSISQDKIDLLESLPTATMGGVALLSKDGKSIYYFGGDPSSTRVYKFSLETYRHVQLASLPQNFHYGAGVSMNGTIFLFDGRNKNVLEFSEDTESAKVIADLPFQSSTVHATSAISDGKDGVWILVGNDPKPNNPTVFFNTTSKLVSAPSGNASTTLPTLYYKPSTVYDGFNNGYLIGGIGIVRESNGTVHASDGILR
jgi:hypothetical protein